jgi:hypothetical protein
MIFGEMPRFVTVRGGEYFLMPSMSALFALGQGSFDDLHLNTTPRAQA